MGNINNKKNNRQGLSNILHENQQGYFYDSWIYDVEGLKFENQEDKKKCKSQCSGNEIFACCLIAAIFIINIGGGALIKNRTKQQLIYSTTPQISSTIPQ